MIKQYLFLALLIVFCTSHTVDTEKKTAPIPQRPLHLALLDNLAEGTTAAKQELSQKQQHACSLDTSMKSSFIWALVPAAISGTNICAFFACKMKMVLKESEGPQVPTLIYPHWLTALSSRLNTSSENIQMSFLGTGCVFVIITCGFIAYSVSAWASKANAHEAKVRAEEKLSSYSLMLAKAYEQVYPKPIVRPSPNPQEKPAVPAIPAATPAEQTPGAVHSITSTIQFNNPPAQSAA